jgi:Protein of unknown function (DUF4238)
VRFAGEEPEPRNPKSVGVKRSLYILKSEDGSESDRVEDWFADEVETPFAALSQRIKNEQEKFAALSGSELGILARFVASQVMRTVGHKESIEEQAGSTVDSDTFVRVMIRKTWRLMDDWIKNPPNFYFYTSLPHVSDQFITGDNPVLVMHESHSAVWTFTAQPTLEIINLEDILRNPKHGFQLSLSPYICVCLQGVGGEVKLPPQTVDPLYVRSFNDLIRGQSNVFTLAKDANPLR